MFANCSAAFVWTLYWLSWSYPGIPELALSPHGFSDSLSGLMALITWLDFGRLWSWPWLWIFKIECGNCYISAKNDPIATKRKMNVSIHLAICVDLGHDLDLGLSRWNFKMAVFQKWQDRLTSSVIHDHDHNLLLTKVRCKDLLDSDWGDRLYMSTCSRLVQLAKILVNTLSPFCETWPGESFLLSWTSCRTNNRSMFNTKAAYISRSYIS